MGDMVGAGTGGTMGGGGFAGAAWHAFWTACSDTQTLPTAFHV